MIFYTRNSAYEVDVTGKRIRRLSGKEDSTPRQGEDRIWKDFQSISDIKKDVSVLIVWSEEGAIPSTLTSPVVKVIEKDVERAN